MVAAAGLAYSRVAPAQRQQAPVDFQPWPQVHGCRRPAHQHEPSRLVRGCDVRAQLGELLLRQPVACHAGVHAGASRGLFRQLGRAGLDVRQGGVLGPREPYPCRVGLIQDRRVRWRRWRRWWRCWRRWRRRRRRRRRCRAGALPRRDPGLHGGVVCRPCVSGVGHARRSASIACATRWTVRP